MALATTTLHYRKAVFCHLPTRSYSTIILDDFLLDKLNYFTSHSSRTQVLSLPELLHEAKSQYLLPALLALMHSPYLVLTLNRTFDLLPIQTKCLLSTKATKYFAPPTKPAEVAGTGKRVGFSANGDPTQDTATAKLLCVNYYYIEWSKRATLL